MNKFLFSLSVALVISGGVYAPNVFAEEAKEVAADTKSSSKQISPNEIIYRTNLGRASDVKILIEKGAAVDGTNGVGVPLISLAASRTDSEGLEVVKVLVEAGADVNKKDSRGQNALFYAAKVGNKDVVEYLLSKNIQYASTDVTGNSARVVAYQSGNNEIVEVIDNFVRGQNEIVRKQYEDANKAIEERQKAYNESVQAQIKKAEEEREKNKVTILESNSIQEAVNELSFASCSLAYWQFCSSSKQHTEFKEQDLQNSIQTQSTRVNDYSSSLLKEYKVTEDVVQNVKNVSTDKIRTQLSLFPSNQDRKEAGVGTVDDMKRRCSIIASSWKIEEKTKEEDK
jgi:ankyrin repeat protein